MKTPDKTLLVAVVWSVLAACGPVQAVIETFDSYPVHTNTTPTPDPPDSIIYWIYGDWDTNSQVVGSWEVDDANPIAGASSAGIGSNGVETYAFATSSGGNPGEGGGIMDFGMHDWGLTSGVIADYLGPNGRDLHGGWMDVRALLNGFSGQIQLGFVSDSQFDDGEGLDWAELVEFEGPIFSASDSFAWYHGDLDDYLSDADGVTRYGDLPGVKVLGVWVSVLTNPIELTVPGEPDNNLVIADELQVDQINLIPEPATLGLLVGGLALLRRRR